MQAIRDIISLQNLSSEVGNVNISVLGCGRWGSCIAWYLDKIGNNVYSWGLSEAPDFQQLKREHKNEYLSYSPEMTVTDDLKAAVEHGEIIIISISSQLFAEGQ